MWLTQHSESLILKFLGSQVGCCAVSKILNGVLVLLFLPKGQVLLEKLDDGLGIPESFLINVVNFLESIRKGLFSECAGLLVVLHHLVVEDGEVQSETESNGVASI